MTIDLSHDKRWRLASGAALAAVSSAAVLAVMLLASLPAWPFRFWQARRDGAILDLAGRELESRIAVGQPYAAAARAAIEAVRRRRPALSEAKARSYVPSERRLAERREAAGDRAGAIELYRSLAARGDETAQWRLGENLAEGPEAGWHAAEGWLRASAQAGKAEARLRLALMLDSPAADSLARAEARAWLRAAADQGHAGSRRELAKRLETDAATLVQAVRLYREAADFGDRQAQIALAGLYEAGRGVAKDPMTACVWYAIAAADPLRVGDFPEAAARRDALAGRLDPKDRAFALRAARRWGPRKD
jgi:hypothetical protein